MRRSWWLRTTSRYAAERIVIESQPHEATSVVFRFAGETSADGGSQAVSAEVPSIPPAVSDLRKNRMLKGVLKATGDILTFTDNYLFSSPSLAAAVLLLGAAVIAAGPEAKGIAFGKGET